MIRLRGMTWNHDRGLAPMVATAAHFCSTHPEVEIEWEVRSLRDFGDAPVEHLATQFDLVVLDHPFMGDLARAGCFLALDNFVSADQLAEWESDSVGRSHASYSFDGHQWALAIDAACQVASYRADLLERERLQVPKTWQEVLTLAHVRRGFVSLALTPLDTLMSFFSLCANAGEPCFQQPDAVISYGTGDYALDMLQQLQAVASEIAPMETPIALYERMSSTDETAYCPLAFGYSNYARSGYRQQLLSYAEIAAAGFGRVGGTLGGAGVAISAYCPHKPEALAYATWIAAAECQRTLYVEAGGQPASSTAWKSEAANALTHHYFRATRSALETAWLRPRFAGFVAFQNAAGQVVAKGMAGLCMRRQTLEELNGLFRTAQQD